jgi:hypothetical protein
MPCITRVAMCRVAMRLKDTGDGCSDSTARHAPHDATVAALEPVVGHRQRGMQLDVLPDEKLRLHLCVEPPPPASGTFAKARHTHGRGSAINGNDSPPASPRGGRAVPWTHAPAFAKTLARLLHPPPSLSCVHSLIVTDAGVRKTPTVGCVSRRLPQVVPTVRLLLLRTLHRPSSPLPNAMPGSQQAVHPPLPLLPSPYIPDEETRDLASR